MGQLQYTTYGSLTFKPRFNPNNLVPTDILEVLTTNGEFLSRCTEHEIWPHFP